MKSFVLAALTIGLTCSVSTAEQSADAKPVPVKKKKFKKNYPVAYNYKKGYVISPFKPHNVLSIKHLKPGMLAYDPYTAKYNKKTKKTDYSKAKIFRVPHPKKTKAKAKTN